MHTAIESKSLLLFFLFKKGTREEWLLVFDIASLIFVFGCLIYICFGSSDLQWWANEKEQSNDNSKGMEEENLCAGNP